MSTFRFIRSFGGRSAVGRSVGCPPEWWRAFRLVCNNTAFYGILSSNTAFYRPTRPFMVFSLVCFIVIISWDIFSITVVIEPELKIWYVRRIENASQNNINLFVPEFTPEADGCKPPHENRVRYCLPSSVLSSTRDYRIKLLRANIRERFIWLFKTPRYYFPFWNSNTFFILNLIRNNQTEFQRD